MRAMKDSGVEWIGQMPIDWNLDKLGNYFTERKEKVSDVDYEPLSVSKGGIVKQLEGVAKTKNNDDRKRVAVGDFAINSRSDRKQSCGLSSLDGSVSVINTVLTPRNIEPEFVKYLLNNYGFAEEYFRWGSGIHFDLWSTRFTQMKSILLPIPPEMETQQKIASYLDQKVALIDNIIEKTKQSIEEYKKYKQSLITETVTKGLNPDVKMKDSGIEWIGEIPEHWNVTKPNRVCEIIRGNCGFQKDDLKGEGDYVALQYGKTYKVDEVNHDFQFYVSDAFYKDNQVVENGFTILVSTSETMEDLGHSCYYNKDDLGLLGGEQMCLKPNKSVVGKFLYYASRYFKIELNQYATGLKVYRFRVDDLKKIDMVLPPTTEQQRIVNFLDRKIPLIDNAIVSKDALVSELEDYKKSLIYEVVTGKKEVD